MENAKLPQPLSFNGNISENYRKFKQQFQIYLTASEKTEKDDEVKVALLLNCIGDEGLDVFNNFSLSETNKKNYQKVIEEFDSYMIPKKNIIYERYVFNIRVQKEGEVFESFLQDLKSLVKTCEYKDSDHMIRDRIVIGIKDKELQEKLIRQEKLSLE